MKKYVYLAGAIYKEWDPYTWRKIAKTFLPVDWEALDPLDFETGDLTPEQLVELDYSKIRLSRAVIARVWKPTWGTAMELAFCKSIGVPVFGWVARENYIEKPSPWLSAHVTKFFIDLELACKELAYIT